MSVINVTADNFEEIKNSDKPVLLDFYADWCGPCKMMAPVLEEISGEYEGKVSFYAVDVDENQDLAQKFAVMSIPTLVVLKKGEQVNKNVGVIPKAKILEMLA